MTVSFVGAEGSTVTLLITGTTGQRLRLSNTFSHRTYESNFDSDGDGVDDSIKVSFTSQLSAPGDAHYGIFLYYNNTAEMLASVDDYSFYPRSIKFSSHEFDVPSAYLGSQHRDIVDGYHLDYIAGNDGVDVLTGGPKDQTLLGGAGNDRLDGRGGDDVLDGGLGRDRLTGGDGADIFRFSPDTLDLRDTVTDFSQGQHDRVDLSAFAGLHFVDTFDGAGPEVRARTIGGDTALVFDLDGDGAVDARITFTGHVPLTPADLILPG